MLIVPPFTIAKTWKQPKCPLTDEWIYSNAYTHAHTHTHTHTRIPVSYRKNEMITFAVTWLDLENMVLSEVSQAEKNKYYMILLKCGI